MRLMRRNFVTKTDSYKPGHYDMLPEGTTGVFSYLEPRLGGAHAQVAWFGLQFYLREYLEGPVVTMQDVMELKSIFGWHVPRRRINESDWRYIVERYGGRLPLRICAVPEGTVVPTGNVLMTVENTDPRAYWLPNYVESLLSKVWYPTTVATRSWHLKQVMRQALIDTGSDPELANYMLHDFGYRGTSSEESAMIGGGAHMIPFRGTDTIEGMRWLQSYYGAGSDFAHSAVATEHMVMTALGRQGEHRQAERVIAKNQNQIVSIVGDSYNYYDFVNWAIENRELVDRCHVRLVIRPDSTTPEHRHPADLVMWTLHRLAEKLGYETTRTGHRVVPYGVLWGDGLEPPEICNILWTVRDEGYAVAPLVFGMGGGLLQKVNRDTERFAFKCSAQQRDGQWVDISKDPLDITKKSKAGRLRLVQHHAGYETLREDDATWHQDVLQEVFYNGTVTRQDSLRNIRARADAALKSQETAAAPAAVI